jgi:hypothetical protein
MYLQKEISKKIGEKIIFCWCFEDVTNPENWGKVTKFKCLMTTLLFIFFLGYSLHGQVPV